jgi:hypothetical protein
MTSLRAVSWEAPEFEYRTKGVSWYWFTIIIAVALVAAAVWQRNFLFGVFVVIAEVLVLAWGSKAPKTVSFLMNDKEFAIDGRERHRWEEFASFSVEEEYEPYILTLRFRNRIRPALHVIVPAAQLPAAKGFAAGRLLQVDEGRSFIETLEDFLRF